jgi:hypothetical protein
VVIRSAGRRAALVAALVGLLAALITGLAPVAAETVAGGSTAAVGAAASTVSAPVSGVVTDGLRAAHPAGVQPSGADRPAPHAGATAVAALLLLLAAGCALLGVRRRTDRVLRAAWHAPAAPRAPPAAAC